MLHEQFQVPSRAIVHWHPARASRSTNGLNQGGGSGRPVCNHGKVHCPDALRKKIWGNPTAPTHIAKRQHASWRYNKITNNEANPRQRVGLASPET
jgi:hypothetical protein